MKNKLLSILAVTAVIVSLTACQSGETGQDIQSSEAVSSTTLASDSTQTSETTAPQNAEEKQIETEYEITDWTMEELLSDVEINGVKLSLPCSYEELAEHFNLELDLTFYNEPYKKYFYSYALREGLYIKVSYYSENETDSPNSDEIEEICIFCENGGSFRVGEIISGTTTRDEVEKILGKPNDNVESASWYRFSYSKAVIFSYDKNNKVDYIHCFWGE